MVTIDDSDEPTIAVDLDMSNMEAQEWVKREHMPLVILEYRDGQSIQSVLVYEVSKGTPVMDTFWKVTDPTKAVAAARTRLQQLSLG